MSRKSNTATVSTYYAGLQFILGHSFFDKITKVFIGDKVAWEGVNTGGSIYIDKKELFGGLNREGGVQGNLRIEMGGPAQAPNAYLQSVLGPVPAYRKVVSAVWEGGYLGTNYFLKEWQFEVTRIHTLEDGSTQWYDETSEVTTQYYLNVISISFDPGTSKATVNLYKDHGVSLTSLVTIKGADQPEFNKTSFNPLEVGSDYFTYIIDPPGVFVATGDISIGIFTEGLMNGVHIVHECLTNTTWGYGYTNIDDTNFRAAALVCFNEGLGFGFEWRGQEKIDAFLDVVLQHIQGSLYLDRQTNLYKINLLRKVEDTSGLLDLTGHYKLISNFERKNIYDLANIFTVNYTDSGSGTGNQVQAQDFSLFKRQSRIVKKSKTYTGVIDPVTAYKIAQRDLLEVSTPTYSFTIENCDRTAETLHKGDAFKVTPSDYLDIELVMRVVSIDLGTATDRKITIQCIQDVFSAISSVSIDNYVQSRWFSPLNLPKALVNRLVVEIPYYIMATRKGDSFTQNFSTTSSAIVVAAESVSADSYSAGLWTSLSTDYSRRGVVDFCFTSTLLSDITKVSTSIVVTDISEINLLEIGSFVQIGTELIQVTNVVGTTLTVIRGVLDTVPEKHLAGALLYAWQDYSATDDIEYLITETVNVKLTTVTPLGEYDVDLAPIDSITLEGRMHLPYPPANVKLDAAYWPLALLTTDPLTLTWATRNRIQQTAGLIGFYTGNITSEAGVTYSGELRRVDTDALLDSFSGNTGTSYTFTTVYVGDVYFKLWSVRDGLSSWQTVTHYFTISNDWLTTETSAPITTEFDEVIEI